MIKISMTTKKEIILKNKDRYASCSKKEKGQILNEICNTTGLSKDRATRLLNGSAYLPKTTPNKDNRGRKKTYTHKSVDALKEVWELFDYACGKRLAAGMNDFLDALQRHGCNFFSSDFCENGILTIRK